MSESKHTPGPWTVARGHIIIPAADAHKKPLGYSTNPVTDQRDFAKHIASLPEVLSRDGLSSNT